MPSSDWLIVFPHMASSLPSEWSVKKSKTEAKNYYFNMKTGETYWMHDNLPFGWTKELECGTKYYFNILDKDGTKTVEMPKPTIAKERKAVLSVVSQSSASLPVSSITSPSVTGKRKFDILNNDSNVWVTGNASNSGQDQQAAASFYDKLQRNSHADRGNSLLFHMRSMNNWVKSILINQHARRGSDVLDLACGKGGDLAKWMRHRPESYLGIDLAQQSLYDAVSRVEGHSKHINENIRFVQADLGRVDFVKDQVQAWKRSTGWTLDTIMKNPNETFDIISMQFALHYIFGEKSRTHLFFQSIRDLLPSGGMFIATTVDPNVVLQYFYQNEGRMDEYGNPLPIQIFDERNRETCRITFDETSRKKILGTCVDNYDPAEPYGLRYEFVLRDSEEQGEEAVNAPEYLIPDTLLKSLLREYDLELTLQSNFHSFITKNMKDQESMRIMDRMHVLDFTGSVADVEWKIAHLYQVLAFKRR